MVFLLNGDLRVEQVDVALALLHPTRIGGAGGKTKQIVVSVKAGHMVPNYVRDSARLTPPGHVVSTEATAYQSSGSGRALAWRGFDSLRGRHFRERGEERARLGPPSDLTSPDPTDAARSVESNPGHVGEIGQAACLDPPVRHRVHAVIDHQ